MHRYNRGRFRQQVQHLRRQFVQDGDLPFHDVLSEDLITQTLTAVGVSWIDRIFSPLVTLWVFLSQVLSSDHSCRAAVARLIAHRVSRGQKPCSAKTGAYCQARERLPESSSPPWLARSVAPWTTRQNTVGCEKVGESTCSMARRSPCPTPPKIKEPIRKSTINSRAWVFRSHD